jgi:predicted 2-oxoglutarate/Fe(II)-dependent dioxygenase YbiX
MLSAKLLAAAESADEHGILAAARAANPELPINWRTVEYHDRHALPNCGAPDRGLMDDGHIDSGSLLTVDVMLSEPDADYEGGQLMTPRVSMVGGVEKRLLGAPIEFHKGDAVVFVSHKEHNVMPVTAGRRTCLVLELWQGDACSCPHRCQTRWGCEMAIARSKLKLDSIL